MATDPNQTAKPMCGWVPLVPDDPTTLQNLQITGLSQTTAAPPVIDLNACTREPRPPSL